MSLNPNGRIPAIIDPAGTDGRPIALWESGAILLYLVDKTGQFISTEPGKRYETLAWVFFQMSVSVDVRSARLLPAIWRQGL